MYDDSGYIVLDPSPLDVVCGGVYSQTVPYLTLYRYVDLEQVGQGGALAASCSHQLPLHTGKSLLSAPSSPDLPFHYPSTPASCRSSALQLQPAADLQPLNSSQLQTQQQPVAPQLLDQLTADPQPRTVV